ncbi:MAG TPA: hypothetical protein VFZ68_17965 [Acidimicrobiales bacterium]
MDIKKVVTIVAVAFVALSIWHNPSGTAASFSDFLSNVSDFAQDLADRIVEFFRGLTA